MNVARTKIRVIIHDIFGPEGLVLGDGQIQPWLVIPVVVDDSAVLYLSEVERGVIAESQDMPPAIEGISQIVESDQTWG